jgi:hypothetical protein
MITYASNCLDKSLRYRTERVCSQIPIPFSGVGLALTETFFQNGCQFINIVSIEETEIAKKRRRGKMKYVNIDNNKILFLLFSLLSYTVRIITTKFNMAGQLIIIPD